MLKWLSLSALVILIDQITKLTMEAWLSFREIYAVLPGLNLTLVYNKGAAFSFLASETGWQRWFFTALALTVTIALIIWLKRLNQQARIEAAAIALIIGGAVGNVIDRVLYGHVIDFIDVYYQNYHWPAFNVADSAICVGAFLLIIDSFKSKPERT